MTLSKTELSELQALIPDYSLEHLPLHERNITNIKTQHLDGGKYTTKDIFFKSFYSFITQIEGLISERLTINAKKSRMHLGTSGSYSVTFNLTEPMLKESLNKVIRDEETKFKNQIKTLQEAWLEDELGELLLETENEKIAKATASTKEVKKKLLSKLVNSI